MVVRCLVTLLLLLVGFVLVGCDYGTTKVVEFKEKELSAKAVAEPSPAPTIAGAVTLKVVDEKEYASVVESHQGKVVLVDFWATWCGPCVKGFPHTVELHNKYKDQGLATISLSFDELANEAQVKAFLVKQDATFDNLLSKYDTALVEAATAFDFEGTLPHYRLYDRTGKLRHSWSPTDAQPEELEQQLAELLKGE